MKRPWLLLSAACLVLPALPGAAVDTPSTESWIVTSAKATGGNGELFVTSLRIVNGNGATANVTLKLLPQTTLDAGGNALGDNTNGPTATVAIPAGQTLQIDDVLATKFGTSGAGGLLATSDEPVVVMSQTLVANARSATGAAGTYGFAIPAQTLDNALGMGETAWVPYISGTPDGATSGYRTNLFLLSGNPDATSTVHVKLLRADGSTVGERDYQLGKLSQTQINRIAAALGSHTTDTNLTAAVTVTSGGPVFLGASVIDNATSSILYTPPSKFWRRENASYGLNLVDGGYYFSGRLVVRSGYPERFTMSLVLDTASGSGPCSSGAAQIFFLQAGVPYQNASFTPDGGTGYTFSGATRNLDGSPASSFTGGFTFRADGSVTGQIVYTRASTPGNACAGVSKTFPFSGTLF